MGILEIGCCGAYCKTCKVFNDSLCNGCKIGYADGTRDLSKAKCKIKVCCINYGYNSCADCNDYSSCKILSEFFSKNGYKYKKYKQALDYIKQNGYREFIIITDTWKMQYGKYDKK